MIFLLKYFGAITRCSVEGYLGSLGGTLKAEFKRWRWISYIVWITSSLFLLFSLSSQRHFLVSVCFYVSVCCYINFKDWTVCLLCQMVQCRWNAVTLSKMVWIISKCHQRKPQILYRRSWHPHSWKVRNFSKTVPSPRLLGNWLGNSPVKMDTVISLTKSVDTQITLLGNWYFQVLACLSKTCLLR